MGVHPDYHKQGLGNQLLEHSENHLRKIGVNLLQVKTLAESHSDGYYARARRFYLSCEF